MSRLPCHWVAMHAHKEGCDPGDYEDAYAVDEARGRFAIADGASESSYANVWARLLVDGYVQADTLRNGWLAPLRQRWADDVDGRDVPWYAEEKRTYGAHAALLGVTFDLDGTWNAIALGDACLFCIRESKLVQKFPIMRVQEFSNRPVLIGSRRGEVAFRAVAAAWQPGDLFLLMTDSIAAWFLRGCEAGDQPWLQVRYWLADSTGKRFHDWLAQAREQHDLVNDDTTVVAIDFAPASVLRSE